MKQIMKKQQGFTLVELLATLALLSMIVTIIISILINGVHYFDKAETNISLQHEANYLLTALTKYHETTKQYKIELDQNPNATSITLIDTSNGDSLQINNPLVRYSLFSKSINDSSWNPIGLTTKINPAQDYLKLKLVLEEKGNPNNHYEIETIISRM